jgi:hypothetical protein
MTTPRLRRLAPAAALVLAAVLGSAHGIAAPSARAISGRWLMDFDRDGTVELTLKRRDPGNNWNSSDDYRASDFQGLTVPSGAAASW